MKNRFDLSKAEQALNLFNGENNFMAMANKDAKILHLVNKGKIEMPEEYFIRTLSDIDIRKIEAPMDSRHYDLYDLFDFYEFTITSKSFFRNQVNKYVHNHFLLGLIPSWL